MATTNMNLTTSSSSLKPLLIGMGNPLLDISAEVDPAFLKKYQLEPNNAILAESSHMPLYEELVQKYSVSYVAGGAAQSSIRGAQWFLPSGSTAFIGCIGLNDYYGTQLRKVMDSDGVCVKYLETIKESTGKCAVLITEKGTKRSLVAHLAAAQHYEVSHLINHWSFASQAQVFYVEGYFLTVSLESILKLALYANQQEKKLFTFNLSAPFLCDLFKHNMDQVLPYCDYLFGNETEALIYAESHQWNLTSIPEIAKQLVLTSYEQLVQLSNPSQLELNEHEDQEPTTRASPLLLPSLHRCKYVIITQGQEDVIVATFNPNTQKVEVQDFPIHPIALEHIVDTNGAGDAFVGGFLAQLVQHQPLETCIKAAVWTAHKVIQQHGAVYPKQIPIPKDFTKLQLGDL